MTVPRLVPANALGDVPEMLAQIDDIAKPAIASVHAVPRPVIALTTVAILAVDPPPAPAMQVKDVLIDRDINLFGGHGGHGKSITLLHLALCVAMDMPAFGTCSVLRPGPVLLILPEDGEGAARMMLDALLEGLKPTEAQRQLAKERLHQVRDECLVTLPQDVGRVRDIAKALGAVLVVADPLRNLLGGGDESDNALASVVIDAFRRDVCRGANATVAIASHYRKPSRDTGADAGASVHELRGGGGWPNGSRLVFGVTKRDHTITLTALKANRLRQGLRHELDIQIEADEQNDACWRTCRVVDRNVGARSDAFTPGKGRSLNANELAALRVLDDTHEPGRRVSWSGWKAASGLKDDTFETVRKRLLDAQLAAAIPTGKNTRRGSPEYAYSIAPQGREILHQTV